MTDLNPFAAAALALALAACAQPATNGEGVTEPQDRQQMAPASQIPAEFRALGTEPFWAVTSGSAGLRYSTPDNSEGTIVIVEDEQSTPESRRLSGKMGDRPFAIELTVKPCSDGMSDRAYPFSARLTLDGETLEGCARRMDG